MGHLRTTPDTPTTLQYCDTSLSAAAARTVALHSREGVRVLLDGVKLLDATEPCAAHSERVWPAAVFGANVNVQWYGRGMATAHDGSAGGFWEPAW